MTHLRAGRLAVTLDPDGWVSSLHDAVRDVECHPRDRRSPLLSIVIGTITETPVAMEAQGDVLVLHYQPSGAVVRVRVAEGETHLALEVASIGGAEPAAVLWGPYWTTVGESVGETVGVARDGEIAVGLQCLNYWTLAGLPPAYAVSPPTAEGKSPRSGYEECAAWPVPGGSLLQAHARRRAPGVPDGELVGSRIALFGCAAGQALATIGRIEVAEGLPHPLLDGEWGKVSPTATSSYLICGFGAATIKEALGYAEAAGLRYVYHPGPFETWGHFALHPGPFPDGDASLRQCVEAAERRGMRVGVHTLSNFITTNDAYVTPVPHPHLQRTGEVALEAAIDAASGVLPVADVGPFRERGWVGAVVVGSEIVRYEAAEGEGGGPGDGVAPEQGAAAVRGPVRGVLRGCERGAFGTRAAAHEAGARVGKLADHAYRVLFGDLVVQDEMADRLVELSARTRLRQISFDGLEGCQAAGHGVFDENRFVKRCYDGWRAEVVNDASRLSHFGWHIHTRMNWGEPWGAAMREGMPEYRFRNQAYFERNLFPRMLGWFLVRLASDEADGLEATTLDDVEWVLARCAGYDAGCAIVADLETLRGNGCTEEILRAVRVWEGARAGGLFSDGQRERLRDAGGEWHLSDDGAGLVLRPVSFSRPMVVRAGEMQPGQPGGADWRVENPHGAQALRFRLRVTGGAGGPGEGRGAIVDPGFTVGGRSVVFRGEVRAGQYLVCAGAREARVCDANWRTVRTVAVQSVPTLAHGEQDVSFACQFGGGRPTVAVRFLTSGEGEPVGG